MPENSSVFYQIHLLEYTLFVTGEASESLSLLGIFLYTENPTSSSTSASSFLGKEKHKTRQPRT
jgi:hypothetical protein